MAGFVSGNDISLHTLSFNLMYDQPNLIGPVGVYAGGGIGVRISSFSFSSTGAGSSSSISGEGLLLQAMAGLTVTLDEGVQLYAGARYSDSGTFGNDTIKIDTASIGIEAGLRYYF